MSLYAVYMQLETPSEVAIAVRILMAIWITIFQVSFFIIFYFLKGSTIFVGGIESAKRLAGFEQERKQERKPARRPAGFAIRR